MLTGVSVGMFVGVFVGVFSGVFFGIFYGMLSIVLIGSVPTRLRLVLKENSTLFSDVNL